jgi:antitoxin component YwqK of YwqJK toxin-antitoxin module
MDNPIVFKTSSSRTAAEFVAAQLQAGGIQCVIQADDCGGMYPSLQMSEGVKLLVDATDETNAKRILEQLNLPPLAVPTSAAEERSTAVSKSKAQFLPGVLLGILIGISGYAFYQKAEQIRERTDEYDHNGLQQVRGVAHTYTYDRNLDGRPDCWYYYKKGLIAQATYDVNFDGRVDSWETYSNGVVVVEHQDTDHNGKPDVIYTYRNGVVQRADWQPNGQDVVILSWRYLDGVCREELRDLDRDGKFDLSVKFDAFQNPTETNYFTNLLTKPNR